MEIALKSRGRRPAPPPRTVSANEPNGERPDDSCEPRQLFHRQAHRKRHLNQGGLHGKANADMPESASERILLAVTRQLRQSQSPSFAS
jgi:hypothetical protein